MDPGSTQAPMPGQRSGTILVVIHNQDGRALITRTLRTAGYEVTSATSGEEALDRVAEATPDVIVSGARMPGLDGLALVARLRAAPGSRAIPFILLTDADRPADIVTGFGLGADDCLASPFSAGELVARVRAKLERPSVPFERLQEPQTGMLAEHRFSEELRREVARVAGGGSPGHLAYLYLAELPRMRARFGNRTEAEIAKQMTTLVWADARPFATLGRDREGRFGLLLPDTSADEAQQRLSALSQRVVSRTFLAGGARLRLTPVIGYAPFTPDESAGRVRENALLALADATARLDLVPAAYTSALRSDLTLDQEPTLGSRLSERLRLPAQVVLVQALAIGAPFLAYVALGALGFDITPVLYILVVAALLGTALLIWVEGFAALRRAEPPAEPGRPCPPASAVIAAYLPNETAIILDTIGAFLRMDYPATLQVILAYNTPLELPIQATLDEIAREHPRFVPLQVEGSTSKAQNVNAALAIVTGEFVGIFDADHQPRPDSFTRAWRWLSRGSDVVQGHCVIRNGDESWLARLVAVEFETIYAVSHPGRARLHRFGIFGGSNGYWRTDLLRQTRMQSSMLTEDIDASLRVVEAGYTITSDPGLSSRELAPVTVAALWNQRMRWAQGWFQVSLRYLWHGLRSPRLSPRQKVGWFYLLGWRELYPWLSVQVFPIIAYAAWRSGGLERIDWMIPVFVLTTLFTLATGPVQVLFAYRLADREIRSHRGWFLGYVMASTVLYSWAKNLIVLVAHLKQAMGERQWKVTPRPDE